MKTQSYQNHIRYYPPHHFIYYPFLLLLLAFCAYKTWTSGDKDLWIFNSIVVLVMFALAFMLRQHYALTLQNRIVLLELRYRYFTITSKRFENREGELSDAQIFALRFAPDEELEALVDLAIANQMSADAIKKTIINWRPDHARV